MRISEKGKQEALALARWTLEWAIKGSEESKPFLTDPMFNEMRGVFVTLRLHEQLRGCVGLVEPVTNLEEGIREMAIAAATRDPRFPPVSPEEMDQLEIEISILSLLEEVKNVSEIEIGKHGLLIQRDRSRGLLLPQVATDENWDVHTFLQHACLKAGLDEGAWKEDDTIIYRFSAEVFSEEKS